MNYAVIQCRLNSHRLPGKAMLEMHGKPVLEHVINRVSMAKKVDRVIVITGIDPYNQPIVSLCEKKNVDCFTGENENVLKRVCDMIQQQDMKPEDNIVRITADCPLIDPKIIDTMLNLIGENPFLGNQNNMIDGFDIEVIKVKYLQEALEKYQEDEHMTLKWKTDNADLLKYYYYDGVDRSKLHLSLDTLADYVNILILFEEIMLTKNYSFNYEDVLNYLEVVRNAQ